MKIVVISVCGVADRHILAGVLARWPTTEVIRPTWRSEGARTQRLARSVRSPVVSGRRRIQRTLEERRMGRVAALLPGAPAKGTIPTRRVAAVDLNGPVGIRQLVAARPDVLVLSGAPILRDGVLALPSIGTLNIHFGISPQYRGEHTLFHALRRRDYDHVGMTLHGVDRGVDTGPLIARAHPALEPSDDEASVFAKCAVLAGELLVEYLEVVERRGRITGRAQDRAGTLYLRNDRHVLRHDLLATLGRSLLGHRPPHRPLRVTRFYEAERDRAGTDGSYTDGWSPATPA